MTAAGSQPFTDSPAPPTGFLEPTRERSRLAWAALRDGRLDDAARHIGALSEDADSDPTWHSFLKGELAVQRCVFDEALTALTEAASPREAIPDDVRLAAMAWERIGLLHRRREELDLAADAHERAYQLREQHGSAEERWESAHSRAVTAALGGQTDESVEWFQTALTCAGDIADGSYRCLAATHSSLADLLTTASRGAEAVASARAALACWLRHDPGSADAARAELRLGRVLTKQGESMLEVFPEAAASVLDDAIARLTAAKEALLAFGPTAYADTLWCGDLLDFAMRLHAACD